MIKLHFKQLTVKQINIVIVALTIFVTFVNVWLYLFIPVKSHFGRVSSQLESVHRRVKEIQTYIPQNETTEEQIRILRQNFRQLSEKVPDEEAGVIKTLTDFMRSLNIDIEFSKTLDRRLLLDKNKKTVEIDNRNCEILPVSFKLKGTYKQLVELITVMRESIPVYISIERLFIEAPQDGSERLGSVLDMHLYLLTKNE